MNELEMDIFSNGEFDEGDELDVLLNEIIPSEGETPESVASKTNQGGEAPNNDASQNDELEEEEVQDNTKNSLYSSLANVLYNEGVLPNLDLKTNKISDIDDLVDAIKEEIQVNEFAGLNERQKRYLEALKGGVPEELFLDVEKTNYSLESLTDEVIEDEENAQVRAELIKEYFLLKGFEDDEATKLTQQQVDLANDIEFAKKAVVTLKQYNNARLEEELAQRKEIEKQREEVFNTLKTTIDTTNKVIEGMPIDKKSKQEILDIISRPVAILPDGTPINQIMKAQAEDPIDFQYKLAYLFHLTKGFKDFGAFTTVKKAKSQAVKEFENVLKKSTLDISGDLIDTDSMDLGTDFLIDI